MKNDNFDNRVKMHRKKFTGNEYFRLSETQNKNSGQGQKCSLNFELFVNANDRMQLLVDKSRIYST